MESSHPSMKHPPIIITGLHRSGTTILGKLLSTANRTHQLYEPFHPECPPGLPFHGKQKDFYVEPGITNSPNEARRAQVRRFLQHGIPPFVSREGTFKERLSVMKRAVNARLAVAGQKRLLLKSPELYFAIEDIYRHCGSKNIVMLRHPVRFVAACKRLGWGFDVSQMANLKQSLCEDCQSQFATWRTAHESLHDNIVLQNAAVWMLGAIWFECLKERFADNPDWAFIQHETFSANPVQCIESLHQQLQLPVDEQVIHATRELGERSTLSSTPSRPEEPVDSRQQHRLDRSAEQILNGWQQILSRDEHQQIMAMCGEFAEHHFQEDGVSANQW